MKEKGVGSDYAYRTNVRKIDADKLRALIADRHLSVRKLADEVSVTDSTIYKWMRRGEMPEYLIDEICEALVLKTTAFITPGNIKLHCFIGYETEVPKDAIELLLKEAANEDGTFSDLGFGSMTASTVIKYGAPTWGHYIPAEWLIKAAIDAGLIDRDGAIMHEDATTGGSVS